MLPSTTLGSPCSEESGSVVSLDGTGGTYTYWVPQHEQEHGSIGGIGIASVVVVVKFNYIISIIKHSEYL